jgi:hypothetical protein
MIMLLAALWYNMGAVKSRSQYAVVLTLTCSLLLGGCNKKYHEIEIAPDGVAMQRSLVVKARYDDLPKLREAYGRDPLAIVDESSKDSPVSHYRFEGYFESLTPDDIGGSGFLLHCESELGTSSMYSEQFRGHSDLATSLAKQEIAFHRLFDIILLWFDSEYRDAPGHSNVRKLIDEDLRSDLWNLNTYLSTITIGGMAINPGEEDIDERLIIDVVMRSLHFLIEHQYIEALQIPDVVEFGDDDEVLRLLARGVAAKMGVPADAPLPAILAAVVDDLEAVEESFEIFLTQDPEVRKMVDSWNTETGGAPHYVFEDTEYIDELADELMLIELRIFGGGDWLRVNLRIPNEPYISNGAWDEAGSVKWDERLASTDPEHSDLPNTLYALWSEPEVAAQTKRFGRIVLSGEHLADYCAWRNDLSENNSHEWDAFVRSLQPGDDLIDDLKRFNFEGEAGSHAFDVGNTDIRSARARSTIQRIIRALDMPLELDRKLSPIY